MSETDALKWVYAMALDAYESEKVSKLDEQKEALWVIYQMLKEGHPIDPRHHWNA